MERRNFMALLPVALLGAVTGRFSKGPNKAGTPFVARGEDGQYYSAVMEPMEEGPKEIGILINGDNTTRLNGTLQVTDDVTAFSK